MALLRHSGIYFLARILAGGAGFAIIAAYTRLLVKDKKVMSIIRADNSKRRLPR
jgi:hypothetical protein